MQFGGSARVLPQSVIELLGQLEELDCSSKSSSGQVRTDMLFPPASVWNGGLPGVRDFFSGDAVDIDLKGAGIRVEDVDDLAQGLKKVAVRSLDLSGNGELGTSGAARLVGGLGRGVKSVSLKGTGLGLAAGQGSQQAMLIGGFIGRAPARLASSDEDWTRLEGALGGLAALEAIDLSGNGALGTSGVGRLVSSCAGELIACVIWFCAFSCLCVTFVCRELATCAVWRQREGCAPECD